MILIFIGCFSSNENTQTEEISEVEIEYLDAETGDTLYNPESELNSIFDDEVAISNGKSVFVIPTMSSKLKSGNNVHCSNLEYLWNEIMKISDVEILTNNMINELNKSKTWKNTLNPDLLILSLGNPDDVYNDLMKQYQIKYHYTNNGLVKQGESFWAYSDKTIRFYYKDPFPKQDFNFYKKKIKGFGFSSSQGPGHQKNEFLSQYKILYYNSDNDFIVQLIPFNSADEIVLVMTPDKNSFINMYTKAVSNIKHGDLDRRSNYYLYHLHSQDELLIPSIKFKTQKDFDDLTGLEFSKKYGTITSFEQSIVFDFNEKGVIVQSIVAATDSMGVDQPKAKKLIFDKPFYLFIREKNALYPYFNLWVENDSILVK